MNVAKVLETICLSAFPPCCVGDSVSVCVCVVVGGWGNLTNDIYYLMRLAIHLVAYFIWPKFFLPIPFEAFLWKDHKSSCR